MTARGIGALGGVTALWSVARVFAIGPLHQAAVALAVLLVLTVLWIHLLPVRLVVDRRLDPVEVTAGGEVELSVRVTNRGWLPTPPLQFRGLIPPLLGTDHVRTMASVWPHRTVTHIERLATTHRGHADLGPVSITVHDPFGFARRRRTHLQHGTITVLPVATSLPPGVALGGGDSDGTGARRSLSVASGDPGDVREYVPGDDPRRVHWPATAHRGRLMVRRVEHDALPTATVLLDARADRHDRGAVSASLEAAVAATASVIGHLDERGRAVVLRSGATPAVPAPRTATGWLRLLAHLEADDTTVGDLLHGAPVAGTLVAVVTPPDGEELATLVRAGRSASGRLALVVAAGARADQAPGAATALTRAGWRATVLAPDEDVASAWARLLGRTRVTAGGG